MPRSRYGSSSGSSSVLLIAAVLVLLTMTFVLVLGLGSFPSSTAISTMRAPATPQTTEATPNAVFLTKPDNG